MKCRSALFRPYRPAAPKQPNAPPRVLSSCVVVSRKRPHRGERFSRPKRSVLAASSKIQLGARIAEAKRRPREAQLPPRKRLIVRGVVPATTQSDLPPMRATARLAPQGQCPNLGGDARRRRKTERGSFSASLLSRKNAALGFGRHKPPASPPTSRRVRYLGEAEKRGLTNTLKGDPRPMESRAIARVADRKAVAPKGHASGRATPIKGLFGDNSRASPIGRGVGSPNFARLRNARASPNAPRRGYPLAEGDPKGALAGVQRIIKPSLGETFALAPRRNAPKRSEGKVPKARRSRPQGPAGIAEL